MYWILIKKVNDKDLIVEVEGRIDTLTSAELESQLNDEIGDISSLTSDFEKLEYMSSAGLRVLIATQKKLNQDNIPLEIINVNDTIKEIFRMSGFDNFNISHSGKYVACAISDSKVGVDIEYNDPSIDLDIAKNYFYNDEYDNIIKSDNPSNEFFKYWVLKESYMKYTGLGFNLDLDSFEIMISDEISVRPKDTNLKFSLFDVNEYKLAAANKNRVKKCYEYNINDLY